MMKRLFFICFTLIISVGSFAYVPEESRSSGGATIGSGGSELLGMDRERIDRLVGSDIRGRFPDNPVAGERYWCSQMDGLSEFVLRRSRELANLRQHEYANLLFQYAIESALNQLPESNRPQSLNYGLLLRAQELLHALFSYPSTEIASEESKQQSIQRIMEAYFEYILSPSARTAQPDTSEELTRYRIQTAQRLFSFLTSRTFFEVLHNRVYRRMPESWPTFLSAEYALAEARDILDLAERESPGALAPCMTTELDSVYRDLSYRNQEPRSLDHSSDEIERLTELYEDLVRWRNNLSTCVGGNAR